MPVSQGIIRGVTMSISPTLRKQSNRIWDLVSCQLRGHPPAAVLYILWSNRDVRVKQKHDDVFEPNMSQKLKEISPSC